LKKLPKKGDIKMQKIEKATLKKKGDIEKKKGDIQKYYPKH
jgi:hypothetical protein